MSNTVISSYDMLKLRLTDLYSMCSSVILYVRPTTGSFPSLSYIVSVMLWMYLW